MCAEAIQNPFYKALAVEVNYSDWICVAMDQLLGRKTGRTFLTTKVQLSLPVPGLSEKATQVIEHSRSKNRI
jgi:hypothetical protein